MQLERVRLTEEQVRADLLAAEHEEESDDDEEVRRVGGMT